MQQAPARVTPMGIFTIAAVLLALTPGAAPTAAADTLTLRIHDAIGEPGGLIAVVLRTYASRPIGQGQVCMLADPILLGELPFEAIEGSEVFSVMGDAISDLTTDLTGNPQQILLQFTSASATVNSWDGPLALLFIRLSDTVVAGQTYALSIDVAGTSFVDEHGQTVQVEPRNGTLTIRAPADPILVAARAEDTLPGATARLSMTTFEPIPLSLGQVGLHYDPAVTGGSPVASIDPRHGNATLWTSEPQPGLVLVNFQSPDGSLNGVPGDLVEIFLPTSPTVPPGTLSAVSLDPALTFLFDAGGQPLTLAFEDDLLEFGTIAPGMVSGLTLQKVPGGMLQLDWSPDCGSATTYAVYRGDLQQGYASLALEPGFCDVGGTTATLAPGAGGADFFVVVPHVEGQEGSYGVGAGDDERPPASLACYPQNPEYHDCAP